MGGMNIDEIVTPETKDKLAALFEQSDKLVEEQSEFIEELQRRLNIAEKVCYAAHTYVRSANSPVAIGWDMLLDSLRKWVDDKAERIKQNEC